MKREVIIEYDADHGLTIPVNLSMPVANNVVGELIRCKDCKHWLPHTQFGYDADYEEYHNYCNRHLPDDDFYAFIKEEDDFCSWAERKGI